MSKISLGKGNGLLLHIPVFAVYLFGLILAVRYQAGLAYVGIGIGIIIPLIHFAITNRFTKKRSNLFFFFYLILILYFQMHIMIGKTVYKDVSRDRIFEMIINLGWGYITYLYFRRQSKFMLISLYTALCFLLTLYQIFETGGQFRTVLTALNINTLGLLCGYCVSFWVYLVLTKKKSMLNYVILTYFVLIVLLTGSRQALIAMSLPTIILLIYQKRRNRLFRIVIVGLGIVIFYAMIMEIPALYNIIGNRLESLASSLMGNSDAEVSAAARQRHYDRAWLLIVQNPIWGYGVGNYQFLAGVSVYSHSNFMEVLVSGGIFALLLYYAPFVIMIIRIIKLKEKTPFLYLLLSILLTQVFIEYFLIAYYRHFTMLIYAMLIAMLEMETGGISTKKIKVVKLMKR